MLQPYDYQQDCLRSIDEARNQGKEKAFVVMASGLGKTITAAFDTKEWFNANPKSKVLYLCHQNDILSQARITFQLIIGGNDYLYGYYHGYEKSRQAQFLFASFQTMRKRSLRFDRTEFDYIIVDESHHVPAMTYMPVVRYFKPKFLLGMTATPDRTDMRDIRTLFGDEVYSLSLSEALARGLLTSIDYRLLTDEIVEIGKLENPYKMSISELNKKIFIPKRDQEIVDIINQKIALINEPRAMIFCPSIRYTEELRKYIPNAVPIHSGLQRRIQESLIQEFRNGSLNTILTVDKFNEGIDIPEVNVVVFLRSTQSKTVFYQQLGRGLRKVLGKDKVVVLDFIANCERLLIVDELVKSAEKAVHNRSKIGKYAPKETLIVNGGSFQFTETAKNVLDVLGKIKTGYTREVLIEQLQNEAKLLGRSPMRDDIARACKEGRMAGVMVFRRVFGSHNKALEVAGLPLVYQTYTKEELIKQLQIEAELLGRSPTPTDIIGASKEKRMASLPVFIRAFGCINKGLVIAKLQLVKDLHRYTKQELVKQLQTEAKLLGRIPFVKDVDKACLEGRMANASVFRNAYGSNNNALKAAGFKKGIRGQRKKKFTRKELISQICTERKILGRVPNGTDIRKAARAKRTASYETFLNYFPTKNKGKGRKWNNVIRKTKLV